MSKRFLSVGISILFFSILALPQLVNAAAFNIANLVGQNAVGGDPQYSQIGSNGSANANGLEGAAGVALDTVGHRLFVSESDNCRIVIFNLNASNELVEYSADYVLGAPDLNSSGDCATVTASSVSPEATIAYASASQYLFVPDTTRHRVLVFDVASVTNNESAAYVLGQSDFLSSDSGTSVSEMLLPRGAAFDSDTEYLYIADNGNNRVLIFDLSGGITNGMSASHVLGQENFDGADSGLTADTFNNPTGLVVDSTRSLLYVSDQSNSRVLVFDIDTIDDGEDAVNVIGQEDFESGDAHTTQDGFASPTGVSLDATGDTLYVSDNSNTRVLVYDVSGGVSDGMDAVSVIGQEDFISTDQAITQNNFSSAPGGSALVSNLLYVTDTNRVLVFDVAVIDNGEDAVNVIGQLDDGGAPIYTIANADNGPGRYGFSVPEGVLLDSVNHHLFVADSQNYRVAVFNLSSSNELEDSVIDYVLGQDSFRGRSPEISQDGIGTAFAMALDSTTNYLYVADGIRVLVYDVTSVATGQDAIYVLGQEDFDSSVTATTQDGVFDPRGVALDTVGHRLFVVDEDNHRVLVYDLSLGIVNGMPANYVLGQEDFVHDLQPAPTAASMNNPKSVAYDADTQYLYVTDSENNRVLVFDLSDGIENGMDASFVLGQPDFETGVAGTTQSILSSSIRGLAIDPSHDLLYVGDSGNNRIMVFDVASIVNGEDAESILCQADFVSADNGAGQTGCNQPSGLAYLDSDRNVLYVADSGNNRVTIVDFPVVTTTSLPPATTGSSYNQVISVSPIQGTRTYELISGALPPGLFLGSVSGTPTSAGIYNFTIRAIDTGDWGEFFDDQAYTLTVAAADDNGGGSGFLLPQPPRPAVPQPSDYNLKEGDVISASDPSDPDVYIINEHGYKRLFLNPIIFNFYGHLTGGFSAIKNIAPSVRDLFPTSGLLRNCETGSQAVWGIQVTGEDTGVLHHIALTGEQAVAQDPNFFKKVFCINSAEQAWYPIGDPWTSLAQIPEYRR